VREQIIRTLKSQSANREFVLLHHTLRSFYAEAAAEFNGQVELVASHGQTVWDEPTHPSLPIGEPAYQAEEL